jgi:hypothetical protein
MVSLPLSEGGLAALGDQLTGLFVLQWHTNVANPLDVQSKPIHKIRCPQSTKASE